VGAKGLEVDLLNVLEQIMDYKKSRSNMWLITRKTLNTADGALPEDRGWSGM
jgi:hypothetical protein